MRDRNLDNACFLNTALQCLGAIIPIRQRLCHLPDDVEVAVTQNILATRFVNHYRTIAIATPKQKLCNEDSFLRQYRALREALATRFPGIYPLNDFASADEAAGALMQEYLEVSKDPVIQQLIFFSSSSQLGDCKTNECIGPLQSNVHEDCLINLTWHTGETLDRALERHVSVQEFDEDNFADCSSCGGKNTCRSKKLILAGKSPPILFVTIRRDHLVKNRERLPITSDLTVHPPFEVIAERRYRLTAVIMHSDIHCTALVRYGDVWYFCDDSSISLATAIHWERAAIQGSGLFFMDSNDPLCTSTMTATRPLLGSILNTTNNTRRLTTSVLSVRNKVPLRTENDSQRLLVPTSLSAIHAHQPANTNPRGKETGRFSVPIPFSTTNTQCRMKTTPSDIRVLGLKLGHGSVCRTIVSLIVEFEDSVKMKVKHGRSFWTNIRKNKGTKAAKQLMKLALETEKAVSELRGELTGQDEISKMSAIAEQSERTSTEFMTITGVPLPDSKYLPPPRD